MNNQGIERAVERLSAMADVWEKPNCIGAHFGPDGAKSLAADLRTVLAYLAAQGGEPVAWRVCYDFEGDDGITYPCAVSFSSETPAIERAIEFRGRPGFSNIRVEGLVPANQPPGSERVG